jgi:5-formyltetrahydrofolate cyclo-ligase
LLSASPQFQKSQHIACYVACQDEFDTRPIIELIWRAKKHCYLPVLATAQKNTLAFYRYEEGDPLVANQYGILEPVTQSKSPFQLQKLDMVLVPVIGFDLQGHRLGTGGGYYDRSFAFLLAQPKPEAPVLIGLAYACQAVDTLPCDPWDVPLRNILTEETWIDCLPA